VEVPKQKHSDVLCPFTPFPNLCLVHRPKGCTLRLKRKVHALATAAGAGAEAAASAYHSVEKEKHKTAEGNIIKCSSTRHDFGASRSQRHKMPAWARISSSRFLCKAASVTGRSSGCSLNMSVMDLPALVADLTIALQALAAVLDSKSPADHRR